MKVLVIDKKRPLAEFYLRIFKNIDFEVDFCFSAHYAIKQNRSRHYDLILFAAHPPWQEFVEAIVVMKEEFPSCKIISFGNSGFFKDVNVARCMEACDVKVIKEPYPSIAHLVGFLDALPENEFFNSLKACA